MHEAQAGQEWHHDLACALVLVQEAPGLCQLSIQVPTAGKLLQMTSWGGAGALISALEAQHPSCWPALCQVRWLDVDVVPSVLPVLICRVITTRKEGGVIRWLLSAGELQQPGPLPINGTGLQIKCSKKQPGDPVGCLP